MLPVAEIHSIPTTYLLDAYARKEEDFPVISLANLIHKIERVRGMKEVAQGRAYRYTHNKDMSIITQP